MTGEVVVAAANIAAAATIAAAGHRGRWRRRRRRKCRRGSRDHLPVVDDAAPALVVATDCDADEAAVVIPRP